MRHNIALLIKKEKFSKEEELQVLKKKARVIEIRISSLKKRINELERGHKPLAYMVDVDIERCVGCGACRDVCPTGAISVQETARVDRKTCIGCGRCAEQCPRGALSLHPV